MDLLDLLDEETEKKLGLSKILFHARIEVPYHGIKKNNRPLFRNKRTGKSFLGKSSRLKNAESFLLLQLQVLKNKYKIDKPFRCGMHALYVFKYEDFYCKNGSISRHVADLSNLLELPSDCLESAGIIYDDKLIHSFDRSRRVPYHKNELDIFLFEFTENLSSKGTLQTKND